MSIVDTDFRYELVSDMPLEAAAWREYAASIMAHTAVALDLNQEQIDAILAGDNGNWKERRIMHYCLDQGRCPLKCNGSPAKAKAALKTLLVLSICQWNEKPLLYRWKGVERANAVALRGRKQHDLLRRGLQKTWPSSVLRQAEREAALHGEAGVPDGIKTAVRASSILKFVEDDIDGAKHEAACSAHPTLWSQKIPPRYIRKQKCVQYMSKCSS